MGSDTGFRAVDPVGWEIPDAFNIAEACCDKWADTTPDRPALLRFRGDAGLTATSFGELQDCSRKLASALAARGIAAGDRIAILLPQSVETVVAHFAAYRLGAIAVPLAALFGKEALGYRLAASGAAVVITDDRGRQQVANLEGEHAFSGLVLSCDDGSLARAIADAPDPRNLPAPMTRADDPAMMIFTSGTTGAPKGAVLPHRVLLGHLPGIAFSHDGFPAAGDRFWTPSDWAWAGGLLNALLPSLYNGVPVVYASSGKFDPEAAFALMAEADVRNAFLPPTAIRLLMTVERPASRFTLNLRTIGSAGESLGRGAYEWAQSELGLPVNEFYGQTECNYVLGSSAANGVSRAGAIGKPIPGHRVTLLNESGQPPETGEPGEIAIHHSDPSMFLHYWNDPEGTDKRFDGDWLRTGDIATADNDGYITFVGRNDDLIISSGYRVGPTEIEDCIRSHPDVVHAAVIGKPDPLRNEIVKAYVVVKDGVTGTPALAQSIQNHVRATVSAAEYPREVSFVDDIPLTTSGKVIRRHFREMARQEA